MMPDELKKFREEVISIAVQPPWCENTSVLKSWLDGFETCQGYIVAIIDAKLKNIDMQR